MWSAKFFQEIFSGFWHGTSGSLRKRILLIFLLLSLLPLVLLSITSIFFVIAFQNQQTHSFQNEISERVIKEVQGLPQHIEPKLNDIVAAIQLLSLNDQEIADYLAYARACNDRNYGDHIEEIALLDQSGREIQKVSRRLVIGPEDLRDRAREDIFIETKLNKEMTIGPILFDNNTFEPFISFGVPLLEMQSGKIKGVLIMQVRVQVTFDKALRKPLGKSGELFITDADGLILAHPNPSVVYRKTRYSDLGKAGFRPGIYGHYVQSFSSSFKLGKHQFWLVSETAFPEAIELARKIVISSICLLGFFLIVCLFLLNKAINYTVVPIEKLAATAKLISQGDWQQRVEEAGVREITMLAKSFNIMTAVLTEKIGELEQANEKLQLQIDTIERMKDEKERIRVKMITQSKLASLGEIATGIAHEINQPLSFIKIVFEAIIQDHKANRPLDINELLDDSKESLRQVKRITVIIDHLRTFARAESVHHEKVDLPTILDNTLVLMRERLRINNIQLTVDIANELPLIEASSIKIEQVFINLFQNSIFALIEKGGGEINIKIHAVEGLIKVEFADSGPGIPAEIREKIFMPFFTTKEVGKGTGLGLSIVYGIIAEHNGEIEYLPKERGTTFMITLPINGK